ncbi:putative bifunctional diguanylate cyclase/phosphodiesterase [Falsiroseomonas tokyonensis]|uniref:Bifunctional diguanylate cyclase/phosphodiesterase n=1 Tax=Falsiroseomonas tokyonensis TaxID=430521 RepID=A0ABV7BQS5_9PROT|nr:bifunctional diguanylate cyclase/phosphodiesterase [Falsiroseomonas tokyonensis]MBU8537907.1 bifunctional diguanylate cyclase/phosphodiesterase [Falsiroseomonas tokyonensis]
MARPALPAEPPSDTIQRLVRRLIAFAILLTLAAIGVNQFLLDRVLHHGAIAWTQSFAAELLRREPALHTLLRDGAPDPTALARIVGVPEAVEIAGYRLLGPDGQLLYQSSATAAAPPRTQAAPPRLPQAEVPLADAEGVAGWLVVSMRETGRRAALREAFRMAQASIATFGAATLLLLLWLGLRGRREEAAAARARYLLRHDSLTGLATHAELRDRLAQALALARPTGRQVGVLVLNLRGFRDVNAVHGRATGDAVLEALALRLRTLVRREDTVARLSADRFAVVQTAIIGEEDAITLAERLAKALAEPLPLACGGGLTLSVELGLAVAPQDGQEAELLLARAEAALSAARGQPEPAIRGFEPAMDEAIRARREIEADLRQAIEAEALVLHYQPQRRLRDRRLTGFEALLRWPHPRRGMIPPAEFIPMAEQNGLIVPLGAWVIRAACTEAARWPGDLRVAVNLSPAQFRHGDLVCTVAEALARSGLSPHRLELEITESLLQEDTEDVVRLLLDLRGLGVSIAMDDFGTGWSSLAHLWRFPFGKLKIDRAFITELTRDPKLSAIVATIVGLGRILDMEVVAEGVEAEDQARILTAEGCEQGQGWLFGRPMPAEAVRRLIAEESGRASRTAA